MIRKLHGRFVRSFLPIKNKRYTMDDKKAGKPNLIPLSEADREKIRLLKGKPLNLFRVLPRSIFCSELTPAETRAIGLLKK
jgi:hypothetical protein